MSDRSYIVVSDGTTACDALRLCGCVPSCFLGATPAIVCATSCVRSPLISGQTFQASSISIQAPSAGGGNLNLIAPAGSVDMGDVVFYTGATTTASEWARIYVTTDGCLLYRSACNGLVGRCVYHTGNLNMSLYAPLASPTFTGNMTVGQAIIGNGSTYLDIYQNTADGSDNKITRIGGGGDVSGSRGGFIALYGNEAAGSPAQIVLNPGSVCCLVTTSGVHCATTCLSAPTIKITTGAASGCVLTSGADGTASWTTPAGGASALSGLTDTSISTPTTGNILTYSGNCWCNIAPIDVTTNLTTNRLVCYDGTTLTAAHCATTECYFVFTTLGNAHGICSCGAAAASGNNFNILGEEGGTNQPGGPIEIVGGCGGLTNGTGGQVRIYGGCGRGTGIQGGQVIICGGNASSSTSAGGHISLIPGFYSGGRGNIYLCGSTGTGGDIYFCQLSTSTAVYDVLIDGTGCISYCTKASDCRLKCNLSIISGATSILNNACGYSAEFYNTHMVLDGMCKYVLLAQDIEADLPLAVQNDLEIDSVMYKRIEYEQIIPVLWNAFKEQQIQIGCLQSEVNTLKTCF